MALGNTMKKVALRSAFDYIEKNPEENIPKLMDWVDRFAGEGPNSFPVQRAAVRKVIEDPSCSVYQLIMRIMNNTDSDVLKATFENFFLNANIVGWPIQEKNREKYGCNIPWAILLDPTSACNLHGTSTICPLETMRCLSSCAPRSSGKKCTIESGNTGRQSRFSQWTSRTMQNM